MVASIRVSLLSMLITRSIRLLVDLLKQKVDSDSTEILAALHSLVILFDVMLSVAIVTFFAAID